MISRPSFLSETCDHSVYTQKIQAPATEKSAPLKAPTRRHQPKALRLVSSGGGISYSHSLFLTTGLYTGIASRRILSSFATKRNLLLKSSFFTNDVFIPSHLCSFKSSDAGGRLSRYLFQLDKIRSISARCFELICMIFLQFMFKNIVPPRTGKCPVPA